MPRTSRERQPTTSQVGRAARGILVSPLWAGITGIVGIFALVVAFLALPLSASLRGGISQVAHSVTPTASGVATTLVPSPTATMPLPTETPTLPPPTAPILAFASDGTRGENVQLSCAPCSDPIIVTIASITVDSQRGNMVWSLTYYNDSQYGYDANLSPFYLTSNISTSQGAEQEYRATGSDLVGVPVSAGQTFHATATFSFVPYKGVEYTLVARLYGGGYFASVTFNPTTFTF